MKLQTLSCLLIASAMTVLAVSPQVARAQDHAMAPHGQTMMTKMTSNPFKGPEANKGNVTLTLNKGIATLEVSPDFVIPKSPAPSWQIVDQQGNTFLLKQFRIVGGKTNTKITLPRYIHSLAKVQVWCSFAEVLLGEASFKSPIMIPMMPN